ncbi:hypothetical protein ASPACDRAFT_241, partial [Aspergillus aculeatus ATCC 16872]
VASSQVLLFSQSSLLSEGQAWHLASTVSQAISNILAHPDRRVDDLNLLSAENESAIVRWNNNRNWPPLPRLKPILDIIHERAAEHPDKIAICAWDGNLTYRELVQQAARMASYLRQVTGLRPRDLIPLFTEKSMWTTVAQLAIWMVGAAFVPLESSHPDDRLRSILGIIKTRFILSSEALSGRASTLIKKVVTIPSTLTGDSVTVDSGHPDTDPEAPAYILFTSGTTGLPKGVVMEQQALMYLSRQASSWDIRSNSRVLQFAAYSFNLSVVETYYTLSNGATLCVISEFDRTNNLPEAMQKMQVSWAALTPSLLSRMDASAPPSSLRSLVLGGESMSDQDFQRWTATSQVQLIQAYGMSEHAGLPCPSPLSMIPRCDLKAFPPSLIVRQWLVNPTNHQKLASIGVVAELLLEGPSLARGYLDNADATASAFIEAPEWRHHLQAKLDGTTPARMYKTGDLFRYKADGSIQYVGRKGTMVKIRGQRLDLGEIEAHARTVCRDGVQTIAESAIPANGKDIPIVALFLHSSDYKPKREAADSAGAPLLLATASPDFFSDVKRIRARLESLLPSYMLPSVYLPLARVPSTLTGKVARRSLCEAVQQHSREALEAYQGEGARLVMPVSETERKLHSLFGEALNLDPTNLGVEHDFLRLGGDSLAAMRVVNLSRPYQYALTVADILQQRTIANLSQLLARRQSDDSGSEKEPTPDPHVEVIQPLLAKIKLHSADVEDVCWCSPVQEGMLYSHARFAKMYHTRAIWEVAATQPHHPVDIGRLKRTWSRLSAQHPTLRTVLFEVASEGKLALQVVLKPTVLGVGVADDVVMLSSPNSLPDEPPVPPRGGMDWIPKFQVYQTPNDDTIYCVLDIHHTLMDASSIANLGRAFTRLYNNDGAKERALLEPAASYTRFARYLSRHLRESTLAYWKSYLQGIPPCIFPRLRPEGAEEPVGGRRASVCLAAIQHKYQQFCHETGLTVASLFKLAWALVLRSFTQSNDVAFTYLTIGRDVPLDGVEEAVGPYLNTLICRVQFDQQTSLQQTAQDMQAEFIRGLSYQQVNLPALFDALNLVGDCGFNTAINFLPNFDQEEDTEHKGSDSIRMKLHGIKGPSEHDMIVLVSSAQPVLECFLGYWARYMTEEQAASVAAALSVAVTSIVQTPSQTIGGVELFSDHFAPEVERWNQCTALSEPDRLYETMQQQCQLHADKPAVDAWNGSLTFGELDCFSSLLAARLKANGIGPGDFVPCCFDRGKWTPVAMLAIIKTGAAFCLLSREHLTYLAEVCQTLMAQVALTSRDDANIAFQSADVKALTIEEIEDEPPIAAAPTWSAVTNLSCAIFIPPGSTSKSFNITSKDLRTLCPTMVESSSGLGLHPHDRAIHLASAAEDTSVMEVLGSLAVGACLCIPRERDIRVEQLSHIFATFEPTWAILTPTIARLLLPRGAPSLNTLLLAGEAIRPSDHDTWGAQNTTLMHLYRPAAGAGTLLGISKVIERSDPNLLGNAPGSPVRAWIVEPHNANNLAPLNAVGELVFSIPQHDDGAFEALATRPPWLPRFPASSNQTHVFRSGHLAEYTSTGSIRLLGFNENPIPKVLGRRVNHAETEAHVLAALPPGTARMVSVETIRQDNGEVVLAAFIFATGSTVSSSTLADPNELLYDDKDGTVGSSSDFITAARTLQQTLPRWKIPTLFLPLQRIPLTGRCGAIDRACLRQLMAALPLVKLQQSQSLAPATELQHQLQQAFAQVLGIPVGRVGQGSDFFGLGGTSVKAMELVAAVRKASGIQLRVADVF